MPDCRIASQNDSAEGKGEFGVASIPWAGFAGVGGVAGLQGDLQVPQALPAERQVAQPLVQLAVQGGEELLQRGAEVLRPGTDGRRRPGGP